MEHLSGEDILVIHAEIIDEAQGIHGVRDVNLFMYLVEKPKLTVQQKEVRAGVFEKAAVYFDSFARHQVFLDGNKRTAIAVAARFLAVNGFDLQVGNQTLVAFTLLVATKKVSIEQIAKWFKSHTRKIQK